MRPDHWTRVTDLAATQHGLVTRAQIIAAGAAPRSLTRAVDRGLLSGVRRQVYLVVGVPSTVWQPLMAACLAGAPHAVASHRAAGGLFGLPGIVPGAVEVTAPSSARRALEGGRCHSSGRLDAADVALVRNIPVVAPARTIIDLAGVVDRFLLARIVDHALRHSLCSAPELRAVLDRVGGRGRPGTAVLRAVLGERLGSDSMLEGRWLRRLRDAGLTPPALQHQVVCRNRVLVLDFAWPHAHVGMEVDGWAFHGHRSAWDHDHDKINAYAEAGWRVLFVTSRTSPTDVVRQLGRFLAE